MQQSPEQESIDDGLFRALAEFFANYECDFERLEQLILTEGYPRYDLERDKDRRPEQIYSGFILEVYVKQALDKFAETNPLFSPSRFTSGRLENGQVLNVDKWGNFKFYDSDADDETHPFSEMDAIYEWNGIPVIFEVTYVKDKYKGTNTPSKKREIAQRLYGSPPSFCKVRPAIGGEDPQLDGKDMFILTNQGI